MPRHIIKPDDFTVQELDHIFDIASDIERNPSKYAHACA